MPLTYIAYARRSSDEKSRKQVQSIEDQLKETRRLAREYNLNVLDEMPESRSAKEPGRPVFNAMLKRIERGEANAILCWKLDRLARNPIDAAAFRWLMMKRQILEIRTPYAVYRPEDNAVITAVENAMAEQYVIDLKINVERGMKSKCEKGGFPMKVPSGYRNVPSKRTVVVDKQCFPLLRRAWEYLLTGDYNVAEIHDLLVNRWGYRNPVGKGSASGKLALSSLYNIFSHPFYKGSFVFQDKTYTHKYRRMVTPEEWDQAQRILRRGGRKRFTRHTFSFTGMIACGSCGYYVTAEKSKGHTYYHCSNRLGFCSKKGIREERVLRQINDALESIAIDPEIESFACEIIASLQEEAHESRALVTESRERASSEIKRQKDALLDLYLRGHLEEAEYAVKKQDLSQQEAGLLQENDAGARKFEEADAAITNAFHFAASAQSLFLDGDPDMQRSIARQLAAGYVFYSGKLEIEINPLLEKVRTFPQKAAKNKSEFEPAKNGSANLKRDCFDLKFPIWWTWLEECRTLVRENNWPTSLSEKNADSGPPESWRDVFVKEEFAK